MTASTEEDALPPLLATREPSDTGCTDSEAISTVVPETHTATGDESTELQVEKEHEVRKARHGTAATEDLLEGSERSTKSEASQTTKTENTTPGKLEEIRAVTNRVVHETLQDSVYDQEKVNEWCETIVDSSLRGLNDLRRPYKYVVTCVIVEKAESGTHTAATAFWDQENDGLWSAHICNSTLDCFTTVFWLRNKSEYGTARSRRS
ncbi:unnamed protein product [Amoebophrya sp. A120]|nr:unnamed protein product [Amoebophrya sp. A120]|eukprot:GSA120T00016624001.1